MWMSKTKTVKFLSRLINSPTPRQINFYWQCSWYQSLPFKRYSPFAVEWLEILRGFNLLLNNPMADLMLISFHIHKYEAIKGSFLSAVKIHQSLCILYDLSLGTETTMQPLRTHKPRLVFYTLPFKYPSNLTDIRQKECWSLHWLGCTFGCLSYNIRLDVDPEIAIRSSFTHGHPSSLPLHMS